ncbi:MAG: hypothetical protein ABIP48_24720 [Planctomycetota bacterium]
MVVPTLSGTARERESPNLPVLRPCGAEAFMLGVPAFGWTTFGDARPGTSTLSRFGAGALKAGAAVLRRLGAFKLGGRTPELLGARDVGELKLWVRTPELLGARGLGELKLWGRTLLERLGALKLGLRTLERLGAVKLGLRALERLGAE